jgi:hypothetical protein
MRAYGDVDVYSHIFSASALDRGKWLASRTGRFTHRERAPVPIGQDAQWTPEQVW